MPISITTLSPCPAAWAFMNILASHHLTKDSLAPWLHGAVWNARSGTGVSNQLVENGSRHLNLVATNIWNIWGGNQQWHVSQKQHGRRIKWKIQKNVDKFFSLWILGSICINFSWRKTSVSGVMSCHHDYGNPKHLPWQWMLFRLNFATLV